MLRCAQHDRALPYYCALAIEPYGRHVPVYDTLNISLKFIKVGSTMMPSPVCRILSRGEVWEEFCNCKGNSPVQAEPLLYLFYRFCVYCISARNAIYAKPVKNLS